MRKGEANCSFQRYNKFYLQGSDICWRVEAVDQFSTPGILEVVAVEYYANESEDDVEAGIVKGLIKDIQDPNNETELAIKGETFIKVKKAYSYTFTGQHSGTWFVDKKYPVKIEVDKENSKKVILTWTSNYSGQFDLYYNDYKKTIVVESLF